MPRRPEQCTGEDTIRKMCDVIDGMLDGAFFHFDPEPPNQEFSLNVTALAVQGIYVTKSIMEAIAAIYRELGWQVRITYPDILTSWDQGYSLTFSPPPPTKS